MKLRSYAKPIASTATKAMAVIDHLTSTAIPVPVYAAAFALVDLLPLYPLVGEAESVDDDFAAFAELTPFAAPDAACSIEVSVCLNILGLGSSTADVA